MTTISAIAFYFYFLWAPIFTVGMVLFYIREFEVHISAIPYFLLAILFMCIVATPVSISGPLPGFMPWWAARFIAEGHHAQSYIVQYVIITVSMFIVAVIGKWITGIIGK